MAEFNGSTGYNIEIPGKTVVSWSIVAQSAATQKLQIFAPGSSNPMVDTSVKSTDLNNMSSGHFSVASDGTYLVKLPVDNKVRVDEAVINAGTSVVTKTFLFAGEDGSDNDYNDAFVTITWFARVG